MNQVYAAAESLVKSWLIGKDRDDTNRCIERQERMDRKGCLQVIAFVRAKCDVQKVHTDKQAIPDDGPI